MPTTVSYLHLPTVPSQVMLTLMRILMCALTYTLIKLTTIIKLTTR